MRTWPLLTAVLLLAALLGFARLSDAAPTVLGFKPPVELVKPKNPGPSAGGDYTATVHITGTDSGKKPLSFDANLISWGQAGNGKATLGLDKALPSAVTGDKVTITFTPKAAGGVSHDFVITKFQGSITAGLSVGLTYQQITWTWTKGGVTASDDWTSVI
jgi:hypothetical protein